MSLPTGTRLGPYEIVAPIGAGGMGEVYRATDGNLKRSVAIKVLPASVAGDADHLARFQREAEVLAALNHPNIAAIHGIVDLPADAGGYRALVMELVEGEDLSAIIARGAIPIADALPIARQIADALEAAHEQGIVHRDLKPANVKVKADGTVKVLDFGLAKTMDPPGAVATLDAANSPTFTVHATQMGMIVGTAAYMAPEQAKGKPADRRADIWAFGVVLYEMLTGQRAFKGDDVSELLVGVMRDTPDFAALPAGTPSSIRRLLRRSFEKDPKKRLSSLGDARLELDEVDVPAPQAASGAARSRWRAFAATAALAVTALAAAAAWYAKPAASLPVRLLELPASITASDSYALSPDGTRVAYVANAHVYVRPLDAVSSQDLGVVGSGVGLYFRGTLFWSPDGKTIGFSAEREIRTIPAAGGPAFAVAKIPATGEAIAARWFHDGTIVFAVWRDHVYWVPAGGGTPAIALQLDPATEIDVHAISEAPEGRLIARIHQRSADRGVTVLVARGAGARQSRVVLSDDQTINEIRYVAPGFVVFDRQKTKTNVGLWVAPYTGGPIDVTKARLLQAGATSPDVADDGSLIFMLAARSKAAPVWVDRAGSVSPTAGAAVLEEGLGFALSPDGGRVAMVLGGEDAQTLGDDDTSLMVRDLATGADTRLTVRATDGRGSSTAYLINDPSWFPSGDRILFSDGEVEAGRLLAQRSNEAMAPALFAPGLILGRLTRDGRTLAAIKDDRGKLNLMHAPVSPDGRVGAPQPVVLDGDLLAEDFDLSPDGRLVVYATRLFGQRAIFLSEFPASRGQWQVAEDGSRPRFSADGREIFYVGGGTDSGGSPVRTLMRRTVTATPTVALGPATTLFGGETAALIDRRGYSVAPDGRRFLTMKEAAAAPGEGKRLVWMQNWPGVKK